MERVDETLTSKEVLAQSINIPENNLDIESDQTPLTPDMSPIIRPEVELSMPHFPLSETRFSVVLDKTQEIILESLLNSVEIYLAKEETIKNKENPVKSSERKYGEGPFLSQEVRPDIQFQAKALRALQKASESYLIGLLEDTNLCTIHSTCVTIMSKHMQLA